MHGLGTPALPHLLYYSYFSQLAVKVGQTASLGDSTLPSNYAL